MVFGTLMKVVDSAPVVAFIDEEEDEEEGDLQ